MHTINKTITPKVCLTLAKCHFFCTKRSFATVKIGELDHMRLENNVTVSEYLIDYRSMLALETSCNSRGKL